MYNDRNITQWMSDMQVFSPPHLTYAGHRWGFVSEELSCAGYIETTCIKTVFNQRLNEQVNNCTFSVNCSSNSQVNQVNL